MRPIQFHFTRIALLIIFYSFIPNLQNCQGKTLKVTATLTLTFFIFSYKSLGVIKTERQP